MRSAVSAILSAPAPESNMSHPDYRQTAHDHSSLLILVKHLGPRLSQRTFSRLYERISRQNTFRIKDSLGNVRTISTRYVKSYPLSNNEWGEFQTHRRVLGLICVGECCSTKEVSEVHRTHESLRTKFSSTLYDSRCLILQHDGTTSDPSICAATPSEMNSRAEEEDHGASTHSARDDSVPNTAGSDNTEFQQSNPDATSSKPTHPARTLYYQSLDKCLTLEQDLMDYVSSLFWVLESKRLVAISLIDKERQPFLCAPFERKDLVGMDLESRTHRKRSVGRWRKQIGDLTFQAGLTAEALEHYQAAADLLRPVNDWLWLAGAFEGLCSASVSLLFPHLRRPTAIQRVGSLTGEGFTGRNRLSSSGLGAMRSLPPDMDSTQYFLKNRFKFKFSLGPDEILEKYHEAVVHYSKYRNAGVIETEASIKAVHVLIEQKNYLSAAEFLQNVVFINLQLTDEEKVQRFIALSELYQQLGFQRKSAFFRRVSAMRCVAPMTSIQPNWNQCYQLLLESINGYNLALEPALLSLDKANGWPALQVQILQELTGTARRLGNVPLAIRHAALLVHLLLVQQSQGATPVLSSTEQSEMTKQLEHLSQRSETPLHAGPLALENGTIIPPVPLTLLPKIVNFKPQPPESVSAARKILLEEEVNNGPFLFTPITFGSFRKQPDKKNQVHMDFQWVEGDRCDVHVQAINPSPYELRISSMQLLTEDVEFEAQSVSVILPASLESQQTVTTIALSGVPRSSGLLKIVGYSVTVLGLKNQCKLKNVLPSNSPQFYTIQVVPALPQLNMRLLAPNTSASLTEPQSLDTANSLQLYAGQSTECNLTLTNISDVQVESFELELRSASSHAFNFNIDNLKAQLPLLPGSAAGVTVYVHGASDFIVTSLHDCSVNLHSNDDATSLPSLSGPPSFLSRLNHATGSPRSKAQRAESLASVRSGASSVRSGASGCRVTESQASNSIAPKPVTAVLKLQYSGGSGYAAGFCRSCNISLTVDILPSIVITKWDVLPAEIPSHCYLVLDIFNATAHEVELHYSNSKNIAIEAFDSCRIPVPVERCPLSKLTHVYMESNSNPEQQMDAIAHICSEHLASLVDLKWSFVGQNNPANEQIDSPVSKCIKGKASLSGLRILPSMLDLLHVPPIQLELSLDNKPWTVDRAECTCTAGDVVNVAVNLLNALSTSLGPLSLQVLVYQDLMNGTSFRRLDTRLLSIGSDSIILEKVEANGVHVHECGVAFFTPGTYKLEVVCSLVSASDVSYSKHSVWNDYEASNRHVWKFVPPVEITVTE